MTGFGATLRNELRLVVREGVGIAALAVVVLLLLLAAFSGRATIDQRHEAAAQLVSEFEQLREALAQQAARGTKSAVSPGAVGYSVLVQPVVLPLHALEALSLGQSDLLADHYLITARGAHQFLNRTELDNPLRLAAGNFDAMFVLVWLLPLVVIALAFDVVSGDRERGVLAMAVAQGVEPRGFLLRKCAARATILAVPLIAGLALAALIAGIGAADLAQFAVWALAVLLYAAFWFALALGINAWPRSSDRNAVLLAGAWLVLVVVLPALTNLLVTTLVPAPSRVELTTELREATEAADRAAASAREQYFFDHPDLQGGEMDDYAYYGSVARSEQSIAAAMQPLLERFDTQAQAQRRVIRAMQYLSPAMMIFETQSRIAGTSGERHAEFRSQTERHHAGWTDFFRTRLDARQPLGAEDYARLPAFDFVEPPWGGVLRQVLLPLAVLTVLTVLLLGVAVTRLRRLSVI